jgi:hypothetical protein
MSMGSEVVVVSGLPRSGTSMMMRMIVAGGIPALTDGLRSADEDNPNGYFELEAVKTTKQDPSWLRDAPGKVVKLVHVLVKDLPATHRYRLVMMHRDLDEVIASQRKMLARSGKQGGAITPESLRKVFESQMEGISRWLGAQSNFRVLHANYNEVLKSPTSEAARVAGFLDVSSAAQAMAGAVDPALYRNKA